MLLEHCFHLLAWTQRKVHMHSFVSCNSNSLLFQSDSPLMKLLKITSTVSMCSLVWLGSLFSTLLHPLLKTHKTFNILFSSYFVSIHNLTDYGWRAWLAVYVEQLHENCVKSMLLVFVPFSAFIVLTVLSFPIQHRDRLTTSQLVSDYQLTHVASSSDFIQCHSQAKLMVCWQNDWHAIA